MATIGEQLEANPLFTLPKSIRERIESMGMYLAEFYELPPQTFTKGLEMIAHQAIEAHKEEEKERNRR